MNIISRNIELINIVCLYLIFLKSLLRFFSVKKYIRANISKFEFPSEKCFIIIPIFDELSTIKKSIIYFSKLHKYCDVIYVTTSREKEFRTYKLAKKIIIQLQPNNISIMNCPNFEGTMAHQLNYALDKIENNPIVGIYNVDSFPDKRTFCAVTNSIDNNSLIQQVSFFNDFRLGLLKSAQIWQNRWSFIYEMGKYSKKNTFFNFKYTIGHGLFGRKDLIISLGKWSEEEINEDNELGYRAASNNINIKTIPYFEKASFAESKEIYVKQQAVWANGPLYAFSYYKKLETKNLKLFFLAMANFKAAISWTFFPIYILILIFVNLFSSPIYLALLLLFIFLYTTSLSEMVSFELIRLNLVDKENVKTNPFTNALFFLFHSLGPLKTIYKIIKRQNTQCNKYKTEKNLNQESE